MLKRYNNIIYKLFLRSKKTIKVILSSITKIRLIIYTDLYSLYKYLVKLSTIKYYKGEAPYN